MIIMAPTDYNPKPFGVAAPANERLAAFLAVRATSLNIAEPLSAEDCAAQSMTDASPVKWHLAHTTWFFETFILSEAVKGYEPLVPEYRDLFNSYYNRVGAQFDRSRRGLLTRPDLEAVLEYRSHVDSAMSALLLNKSTSTNWLALAELGIQHEQQHQELMLTDVKHLFSLNPLRPVYREKWPLIEVRPRELTWKSFPGGVRAIGAGDAGFAFDNERPRHEVLLHPFEIAGRLTTNGEYLEFINDGGYDRPEFWLSDGWDFVARHNVRAPQYWRFDGGEWRCFTLHGDCRIDPFAPVSHVSYYEADAFARWSGARLPTEAEWECAAADTPLAGNFLESGALHPLALRHVGDGSPTQLFGDVWEWMQSPYNAYPGYAPASGAIGEYNGKFMNGQYVLRGGSCVTPASHIRATYRNFFPPSARWQFAGVRLARDVSGSPSRRTAPPSTHVKVINHQSAGRTGKTAEDIRNEILEGLAKPQAVTSPKFFYDLLGSHLFDAITKTPEYYQTRTERGIFDAYAAAIGDEARKALGLDFLMVDIGAGDCEKAASLFGALSPAQYAPVDISGEFLEKAIAKIAARFPSLPITGIVSDFAERFSLPGELSAKPTLFFYPGSSIGNFSPVEAARFISEIGAVSDQSALLLGVDIGRDRAMLDAAYDDSLGVTSAFNLNVLNHVNRAAGTNFNARQWRHRAIFEEDSARIEMQLVASEDIEVSWPGGGRAFSAGEHIVTEHSYKWKEADLATLVAHGGFMIRKIWTDPERSFAVALAAKAVP